MSTSPITLLLIIAVVIYMIIRQVTEQPIRPAPMLLIPALIAYDTYINVVSELTKPLINPSFLITAMAFGLALGGVIGFFRGEHVTIRLDAATGTMYSKPGLASILIWFAILLLRIGSETLASMGFAHTSVILALFIALTSTLFLGNILVSQLTVFLRSQRYPVQRPAPSDLVRW